MKPLAALTRDEANQLRGLLFDLDDTVLDGGRLGEEAYSALFRLREAGLLLIAVTGRPASWAELIARQWPVDAAIAENGPIGWFDDGERLTRFDSVDVDERNRRAALLAELIGDLRRTLPALVPADDVNGRVTDFAFDINEHHRASEELVAAAVARGRAAGAATFRSSVHLHFTFDRLDKATGALRYLRLRHHVDPTAARRLFAFIGDSENDAPCFAAFRTTIAVANLRGRPPIGPRFITEAPQGRGFAEAARALVALRG
ncbi:MAG: HAD-IIB family hydrolase [Myxococcales bacterium]|nr:HAD-IIB family hydrolase [Myxococcales bacterium]